MSRIAPALADGRAFTNYMANNAYNEYLQQKFNAPSSSAFRIYLQQHADQVMRESRKLIVTSTDPNSATWSDGAQGNWAFTGSYDGVDEASELAAYNQ